MKTDLEKDLRRFPNDFDPIDTTTRSWSRSGAFPEVSPDNTRDGSDHSKMIHIEPTRGHYFSVSLPTEPCKIPLILHPLRKGLATRLAPTQVLPGHGRRAHCEDSFAYSKLVEEAAEGLLNDAHKGYW